MFDPHTSRVVSVGWPKGDFGHLGFDPPRFCNGATTISVRDSLRKKAAGPGLHCWHRRVAGSNPDFTFDGVPPIQIALQKPWHVSQVLFGFWEAPIYWFFFWAKLGDNQPLTPIVMETCPRHLLPVVKTEHPEDLLPLLQESSI